MIRRWALGGVLVAAAAGRAAGGGLVSSAASGAADEAYLTADAATVFAMPQARRMPPHIEAMWSQVMDTLDAVDYVNDTYSDLSYPWPRDKKIAWRHALATMGYPMPSVALIEASRTREVAYNLHLVVKHLQDGVLADPYSPFDSEEVLLTHQALASGLYRLVSGRKTYDELLRRTATRIRDRIVTNGAVSGAFGIDTVKGIYEPHVNAMALMALEVHDRALGGQLSQVRPKVLEFIERQMTEPGTGLLYGGVVIPQVGLASEDVTLRMAQVARTVTPACNALAISYLNAFRPEPTARAWKSYKERFRGELLKLTDEDLKSGFARSFVSPIGQKAEAFLASMLAAKEMGDPAFYQELETRLKKASAPVYTQGGARFGVLTDAETTLICGFALHAKAHAGWRALLGHDWSKQYDADYEKAK